MNKPMINRLMCAAQVILATVPVLLVFSACKKDQLKKDITVFDTIEIKDSKVKTVIKKDSLGNKLIEGNVIDGKKNGVWVTFYPGGQIEIMINYIDDIKQGPYIKLGTDNRISEQGSYMNNLLHGPFTRYLYGYVDEKFEFKNGLKHGILKKYYLGGGVQREMEYKEDIQDGIYRFYGENGALQIEEVFRQGKKISGGMVPKSR